MIVIAIIIILAAIAIPNYLRMTERAKVSAIESDMKAIGTALEAYNTDWTTYPVANDDWGLCEGELLGFNGTTLPDGSSLPTGLTSPKAAQLNVTTKQTATGEKGGISYIKPEALLAFETKVGVNNHVGSIHYTSDGGTYKLTVTTVIGSKTYTFTMTPGGQITVSP
jgi:type II secretory pathway pseudopilin PulG